MKVSAPFWTFPVIVTLKVTVPLPFTIPLWLGASVTAICEESLLPDRLIVVVPPASATFKLMGVVVLLESVKKLGSAVKVHGFAGVGVGDGLQFTPLP